MKCICISVVLFLIVQSASATFWEYDDAIIVDAELQDDPTNDEESTTSVPMVVAEDNSCISSRGASGTCIPMKKCYPYLNLRDDNGNSIEISPTLRYHVGNFSEYCEPTAEESNTGSPNVVAEGDRHVCCTPFFYGRAKPWPKANIEPPISNNNNETVETKQFGGPGVGVTALNTNCGKSVVYTSSAILGGRPAKLREFPWAVAIFHRGQQRCGGSVINNKYILTAAHCLSQFQTPNVKELKVYIGDHDYTKAGEVPHIVRGVATIKYHKKFSSTTLTNDVALMKLSEPVQFTENIRTVCLPSGQDAYDNYNAAVAGWGFITSGGPTSPYLKTISVNVIPNQQCSQSYAGTQAFGISASMVCATSSAGQDACQGDSGGPMTIVSRGIAQQIGVVSWGIGCGQYPGVYTRVGSFYEWIRKHSLS